MKLYYAPNHCSMAPHIVLREADCKFDLEKVDVSNKRTASGEDYWKINPKGYVPALELDDGEVITEAQVICQYLADHLPGAGLAPKNGTMERYRLMELLNFTATEVHKQIGLLFRPGVTPAMRAVQMEYIERRLSTLNSMLEGKRYAAGETFSIVDPYLFVALGWCNKLDIDLGKWPNIRPYLARVAERPAVQAALRAEGLLK